MLLSAIMFHYGEDAFILDLARYTEILTSQLLSKFSCCTAFAFTFGTVCEEHGDYCGFVGPAAGTWMAGIGAALSFVPIGLKRMTIA